MSADPARTSPAERAQPTPVRPHLSALIAIVALVCCTQLTLGARTAAASGRSTATAHSPITPMRDAGAGGNAFAAIHTTISVSDRVSVPKYYECQHPTTTGEEASHLRHVSPKVACAVVRELAKYVLSLKTPKASHSFYVCKRHRPVLRKHRFRGWRLQITAAGFTMSRGNSRFSVGGTDFPVPC